MTGSTPLVEIDSQPFIQALERLAERAADLTPALRGIGEYLRGSSADRFDTQTAPDGTAWKPLHEDYKESKSANKDKVLTLNGYLRKLHWQVAPNEVAIGSNLEYAAIHQFGGVIKPKNGKALAFGGRIVAQVTIPARAYLGVSDVDAREIEEQVADYLADDDKS